MDNSNPIKGIMIGSAVGIVMWAGIIYSFIAIV